MEKESLSKTYFELAELAEEQGKIIKEQSKIIAKLLNESVEKENMINELLKESV